MLKRDINQPCSFQNIWPPFRQIWISNHLKLPRSTTLEIIIRLDFWGKDLAVLRFSYSETVEEERSLAYADIGGITSHIL